MMSVVLFHMIIECPIAVRFWEIIEKWCSRINIHMDNHIFSNIPTNWTRLTGVRSYHIHWSQPDERRWSAIHSLHCITTPVCAGHSLPICLDRCRKCTVICPKFLGHLGQMNDNSGHLHRAEQMHEVCPSSARLVPLLFAI